VNVATMLPRRGVILADAASSWIAPRWCPTPRQVRTKRVTKNVNPAMFQLRRARRMVNVVCDDLFVQRPPIPIAKHEGAAKMS
jgi:hypothetical protein